MNIPKIRDILYFDFEKASSIWSQLQWGQVEKISVSSEENKDQNIGAGLGVPNLANFDFHVGEGEKRSILETRILHHDLLNRIESFLMSEGLVIDINRQMISINPTIEDIHKSIGNIPYIIATGWSVIEDYQRILLISEKFNDLSKFIGQSAIENMKEKPEYIETQEQINDLKKALKSITDPNRRAASKAKIQAFEKSLQDKLQSQISGVDQWILDGIKLWITTFMPTRIKFSSLSI